jgi:RNA polymerase sigma-70 factor (ECF subfamily)
VIEAGTSDPLDALVADAMTGSPAAFAGIWEALSPSVLGYVRARGVRDAEDVTSEVFLAAYRGLGRFIGEGEDFRRWLFTIAHRRSIDHQRRSYRAREVAYDAEADARATVSAESQAFEEFGAGEVGVLLQSLPADQREVLLLRVVADLPVADVAVTLGRSPDAVRQLQRRALQRLRSEITRTDAGRAVTARPRPAMTES